MRYAIYFVPAEDHPLSRAAADWLGRDAFSGAISPLPQVGGLVGGSVADYLSDPARYGFHATMKAPFELASGRSEPDLVAALERFAASRPAVHLPEIVIRRLGRFFALVPNEPVVALDDLAAEIVRAFEPFRAPLSDRDIARRRTAGLTLAEEENLLRWGYPYVFDAFRFHMSLTGRVPKDDVEAMEAALKAHFAAFDGKPLTLDGLAVFAEPDRGAPFFVKARVPLGDSSGRG